MLWCVHYASSYWDSDPRAPGTVPVDARVFVVAKSRDEALRKAGPELKAAQKRADAGAGEKVTTIVLPLEELVPARDCGDDGRLGWHSVDRLAPIELCEEDAKEYELAVVLRRRR